MKPLLALTAVLFLALLAPVARAEIKSEPVEYTHDNVTLQGFVFHDDKNAHPRPGVIVVHEWFGVNDFAKRRARMLAELGYVAFVADMYGKGVVAKNVEEASKLSGGVKSDRALMRGRVNAALDALKKNKLVDPARVAAIGYCFGGTTALELARSGAELAGVVSFHGDLATPAPVAEKPKAKILVLHGALDPFVPPAQVQGFLDEMNRAGADYQLLIYSDAVHSFTNPGVDALELKGAAYNEPADRRSWEQMKLFFAEIFKK